MARTRIRTRDYNMVNIITGATKAGVHVDRKKRASAKECRRNVHLLFDNDTDRIERDAEWDDGFTGWSDEY